MFSIGEFSKITGLTIKTLRFYHEQGLLEPSCVDDQTGYRYYDDRKVEAARIIAQLRDFEFPLAEIAELMQRCDDESDMLQFVQRHRAAMAGKADHFHGIVEALDRVIAGEQQAREALRNSSYEIEEKTIPPTLIAGLRMQGHYRDCGQGFAQIGRTFGRHICGKPMLLIFDTEYKEDDADFEPCMPVRQGSDKNGISVRELPGGSCLALIHKGPYDQMGRAYQRLLSRAQEASRQVIAPCREIFIKGPGMIFRGNPKKYLTEIQLFFPM